MLASIIKVNGYNPFKALMLREYWENRRAIFMTPLVILTVSMVIIILDMAILGESIHFSGQSYTLGELIDNMSEHDAQELKDKISQILLLCGTPIMIGVWFCMVFTALGSLYDERKDNSILFWKSMPVSDLQTILAKLLTVTLVIPFVAIGFIFIFQIFVLIVGSFATIGTSYSAWDLLWSNSNLLTLVLNEFTIVVMYSLWALPIFAWFMLASVLAKRTPLLLATIPIALGTLFESLFFDTHYLIDFVGSRLSIGSNSEVYTRDTFRHFDLGTSMDVLSTAMEPGFWLGLAIAAGLLYATILLRKRSSL